MKRALRLLSNMYYPVFYISEFNIKLVLICIYILSSFESSLSFFKCARTTCSSHDEFIHSFTFICQPAYLHLDNMSHIF